MVQCYVSESKAINIPFQGTPKLLYVSHADPQNDQNPRVMHAHNNLIEIILIIRGEGQFMIHDRMVNVKKGDMAIYNSQIVHDEYMNSGSDLEWYCIAIGDLKVDGFRENALIEDGQPAVFDTGNYYESMKFLMETTYNSVRDDMPYAAEHGHYYMMSILLRAYEIVNTPNVKTLSKKEQEERILGLRIKEYIDKHFMEELTLDCISGSLNISSYYMSHVFKNMTGYSPIRYITKRRIGEAQSLLISTTKSITDIALEVGYDSPGYFDRVFAKEIGVTPKKFRKEYVSHQSKK